MLPFTARGQRQGDSRMLHMLYEDDAVLVVWKPVGMESQSGRGFDADMVSEIKRYLSTKKAGDNHNLSTKVPEPYVGVIHRLDKPVSGVMVYAKTKEAAGALSKQVSEGKMHKKYLTVLCGKPVDNVEKYVDYLLKDEKENTSRIVDMGITGGKRAELICRTVETKTIEPYGELTLAEIELLTGRHHQIRVQMSGHGTPIWGDNRYNPAFQAGNQAGVKVADQIAGNRQQASAPDVVRGSEAVGQNAGSGQAAVQNAGDSRPAGFRRRPGLAARRAHTPKADVALAAFELTFAHPVTGESMTFRHEPSGGIFRQFEDAIRNLIKK